MTPEDTGRVLGSLAQAAQSLAPVLPGGGSYVAHVIGAALGLAADLAAAGDEPIAAIARIRSSEPVLVEVEAEWERALRERFRSR